jgi:hypothetical protein
MVKMKRLTIESRCGAVAVVEHERDKVHWNWELSLRHTR